MIGGQTDGQNYDSQDPTSIAASRGKNGGWWRRTLLSPDGVAPIRMVGVSASASVNFPLHHKVQKFSTGTGSPGWSRKKGCKTVVVVVRERTTANGFHQMIPKTLLFYKT